MQLEIINCPICDAVEHRLIFKSKDYRFKASDETFNIVRCIKCDFIFLNPRPSQSESAIFYPRIFYQVKDRFVYKLFGVFYRGIQALNNRIVLREKRSGRLLDIGCGRGDFLLSMQRKGYDVYGVEVSGHIKPFIPGVLKNRIFEKKVEECRFPGESFDIVTMFQSLEHIHNLNSLMQEIKRILKPDGLLYFSVPNFNFFEYRILGPYAYTLEVPRHLYFFTKYSLNNLLDKHGFANKHFRRCFIGEFFSTPASIYHGVWYYMHDKLQFKNKTLEIFLYLPLVLLGMLLHVLLVFEGHTLHVTCRKSSS